ncbi:MAG TPA: YHS domain-containing protein [Planctomycetaceae bacterium]
MVSRLALGFVVAASAVSALTAARAADEEGKKVEVKCPVSGKPINKEHSVAYKGGEVYFCCPNCPKAFEKDTAKFATKANHQLVLTEQAEQKKCPITGRPLNKEQKVTVAGAEVTFCCPNCKGKVAKAEGEEQMELVFSDKAFEKAYEVKKEDGEK